MKLLTLLQEGTWNNGKDPSKDKDYQQLDLIIDSDNCIIINLTIANPTLFSDATEINQKIQDLYDQLVVELQQFHLQSDPKVLPIQTEFYKDKNSLKITRKGIDKLREHVKTHSSKAVSSPLLNLIGLLGNDKLLIKFCITELINSNVFRYVAPSSTKLAEPHYYLLNGDYNKGTMGVLLSEKFSIGIATLLNRRRGDIEFREHFKIPGSLCEETVILINPTDYRTLSILLQDVNVAPPSSPQAARSQSHGTAGASPSAVAASEITLAGAIAVLPPHFPALPKANAVVFTPASTESASIPAATDTSAAQANPAEKSADDLIDKRHDSQLLHEEMKMKFLELLKKGILTFQDEENGTKYNESVTLNVNESAPGLIIQISVERDKDTKEVKDDKADQSDKISGQLYNSLMQDLTSKYNLVANESFTVDPRTRSIKITKRGLEKLREYCDKNAAVKSIIEPVLILADLYSTEAKLKKDSIAYLIQDSIILHTQEPSVKNDVTSPPTHKYFINPDFHGEGSTELHKLLFRGFATALSVLLSKRVSGSKDETVNKKRVRVFCINASEQRTLEEDLLKFQIPVLQLNQDSASALPPLSPAAADNATVAGANTSPRRPPSPSSAFSDLSPSSGSTVPSSNGAATAALAVVTAEKRKTRGAESGASSATVPFDLFADSPSDDGTAVPTGTSAIPTRAGGPPTYAPPPVPTKASGSAVSTVPAAAPAASVVSTSTAATASAPEGDSGAGSKPAAATSAPAAATDTGDKDKAARGSATAVVTDKERRPPPSYAPPPAPGKSPSSAASTVPVTTPAATAGAGSAEKSEALASSAEVATVLADGTPPHAAPPAPGKAASRETSPTASPAVIAGTSDAPKNKKEKEDIRLEKAREQGGFNIFNGDSPSGAGSKPATVAASAPPAASVVSTSAAATASAPEGDSGAGSKPAVAVSSAPPVSAQTAAAAASAPEGGSGAGNKPAAAASATPVAPAASTSTAATASASESGSGAGSKPAAAVSSAPSVSAQTAAAAASAPEGGSGAGSKPAAAASATPVAPAASTSTAATASASESGSGAGSKPAAAVSSAPPVSAQTAAAAAAPVSSSGAGSKPAAAAASPVVSSTAATASAPEGGSEAGSKPAAAASATPVAPAASTPTAATASAAGGASGAGSKPAAAVSASPVVSSTAATASAAAPVSSPGTGSRPAVAVSSALPVSAQTAAATAPVSSSGAGSKPAAAGSALPRPVPPSSSGPGAMQPQTGSRASSPPRMQRSSFANSSNASTGVGRGGRAALTASRTSPPSVQPEPTSDSSSAAAGVWPTSSAYAVVPPSAFGGQRPPEQSAGSGGKASRTSPPPRGQAPGAYSASMYGVSTTSAAAPLLAGGRGALSSGVPVSPYSAPLAASATLQDRRSASAAYDDSPLLPPPSDTPASRHRPPAAAASRAKSEAVQRAEFNFQQGLNFVRNAATAKAHLDKYIFNVAVQPYAVKEAIRDLIFDVFDRVLRGQPESGRQITDELCDLFAYINLPVHKEKINIRANPRLDWLFSKPNTNSWVNIVEWLREQATQQLFRDAETAHPLDLSRRKIFLLGYREHNLFAEHTSNKYLATIGRTRAVKAIDEKIYEIDHPKRPTHTKNRHSVG